MDGRQAKAGRAVLRGSELEDLQDGTEHRRVGPHADDFAGGAKIATIPTVVAFEYLSEEQTRRYGAFVADPAPEETGAVLPGRGRSGDRADEASAAQPPRLVGTVATVRMLGTFLEDPLDVPQVVVDYAAEQLGVVSNGVAIRQGEHVPTPRFYRASIQVTYPISRSAMDGMMKHDDTA